MRRIVKIVLIFALLSWGSIGLRHAPRNNRSDEPGAVRANDPAPLSYGHSFWPNSISLASTRRFEIFEEDENALLPSRIKWLASQAVTWAKDYEIEE